MDQQQFDLIVIGAGPGGYVAAVRAAQLGLHTACVEREKQLGGTCLRVGCIPSKALLESSERYEAAAHQLADHGVLVEGVQLDLDRMMARKQTVVDTLTAGVAHLLASNGITRFHGHARLTGPGQVAVEGGSPALLQAPRILIATGSRVAPLRGVEVDGDRIGDSTTALSYPEVPEHLVLIGAGAIGLELGSVWRRLGARVTVLEYLDRILPGMDGELARRALKLFRLQGLEFHLGVRVTEATVVDDEGCRVMAEGCDPFACDRVLLATGRRPNTEGLGLDAVGLATDAGGRIPVDDQYRTACEGIWAVGDVIDGPMLAHKAEEEGIACVERMVTGVGHVNYDAIPSIVYTHPELASVGRTQEQLKADGVPFRKGSFPFSANGRARAMGETDGLVKVLAHAETDRLLGVHILGPRAGDLIAEAAVAIEMCASAEDLARCTHAHPTLAEAIKEAALAVDGRAIHA